VKLAFSFPEKRRFEFGKLAKQLPFGRISKRIFLPVLACLKLQMHPI
jgi:hypothetical protein